MIHIGNHWHWLFKYQKFLFRVLFNFNIIDFSLPVSRYLSNFALALGKFLNDHEETLPHINNALDCADNCRGLFTKRG